MRDSCGGDDPTAAGDQAWVGGVEKPTAARWGRVRDRAALTRAAGGEAPGRLFARARLGRSVRRSSRPYRRTPTDHRSEGRVQCRVIRRSARPGAAFPRARSAGRSARPGDEVPPGGDRSAGGPHRRSRLVGASRRHHAAFRDGRSGSRGGTPHRRESVHPLAGAVPSTLRSAPGAARGGAGFPRLARSASTSVSTWACWSVSSTPPRIPSAQAAWWSRVACWATLRWMAHSSTIRP